MDPFAVLAILYLLLSIATLYFRPELIIGIQLFATPIFGHALNSLGIGIGAAFAILVLSIFSLIVNFFRNKHTRILPSSPIEIAMILFLLWVAITLIYTPSPSYGSTKFLTLITISFPLMYTAAIYCDTPLKLRQTFTTIGCYAICLTLYYASYVSLNYSDVIRVSSTFFGPLGLGYIAISMVPFIFYVAVYSQNLALRLTAVAAIPSAVLVAIATGSRGPLVALGVAIFFSLLRVKYFFRVIAGFAVALVAGIFYISSATQADHKGLERILGGTEAGSRSSQGRNYLFSYAIEQFKEFPIFGQGSGSFSYFVQYADGMLYAHNLFLEIAGEFGLLGLTTFCAILLMCMFRILSLRQASNDIYIHYYWAIASIQAVFFAGIMTANFSFALPFQRILFAGIGILAATTYWNGMIIYEQVQHKSAPNDKTGYPSS